MTNIKIGIIGCGGIGSYFIRGLSEMIKRDLNGFNKINPMAVDLFDYDMVEEKNLLYQNFDIEDLNRNKAEVLAEKTGYNAITEQIEKQEQIINYDFIILCVDNNKVRNIVYETELPFLDLRANGKTIMAYLTKKIDLDYLEITKDNEKKGSCQYNYDIEEKNIQCGNRIIAEIGLQILADYLREEIKQKNLILSI